MTCSLRRDCSSNIRSDLEKICSSVPFWLQIFGGSNNQKINLVQVITFSSEWVMSELQVDFCCCWFLQISLPDWFSKAQFDRDIDGTSQYLSIFSHCVVSQWYCGSQKGMVSPLLSYLFSPLVNPSNFMSEQTCSLPKTSRPFLVFRECLARAKASVE